jgi:hypothetical protein
MPLPGGASEKAGNSYERRWTVLKVIELLERRNGSIRIEVPGDVGLGAEFRLTVGTTSEWHQVKRQRAEGNWSINALRTSGVLGPWWPKLTTGDTCCFVSGVGAPELMELAERSRSAECWSEFDTAFLSAKQPRENFNAAKAAWPTTTDEHCYEALQRVEVVTIDEDRLKELIKYRLAACIDGDPAIAAALLAEYVGDSVHQTRSSADVVAFLAGHGIGTARFDPAAVSSITNRLCTNFLMSARSLRIAGRQLSMVAIDEAIEVLHSSVSIVVTGAAGGGKSVVLAAVLEHATVLGWPTLVIAADRIPDCRTAEELGSAMGFRGSPATALAMLADGGEAVLILDQLDAIGVVSGRHPERLAIIESLVLEARAHPNIRVVLGCREFDLDNDRALRQTVGMDAKRVRVSPLEPAQISEVLEAIGVAGEPSESELRFLSTPLNLALLTELAHAADTPPAVPESIVDLYDQFWEVKRQACMGRRNGIDQWLETVQLLVDEMSARQALAVPQAFLDPYAAQAAAMESEAVVTTLQRRTGFVHETFFDYSWSRRFVARSGKLNELLTSSEQDLFRRSQVRQLLTYERSSDPTKYLVDLDWLLTSDDVRMHIKVLVISLVASVAAPTEGEWTVVAPLVTDDGSLLADHFWGGVRGHEGWFDTLDRAGAWQAWMSSGDTSIRRRTLWLMAGLNAIRSTEIANLLISSRVGSTDPTELLNLFRSASTALGPQLVDLLRSQVTTGSLDDYLPAVWSAMLDVARVRRN